MEKNQIDEQYVAELDKEYEQLKEIASTQGLTVAEYLKHEVKKLLNE